MGLFATGYLASGFEDLAALIAAGAASYFVVTTLPGRRAIMKSKVEKIATNFVADVRAKMKQELEQRLASTVTQVRRKACHQHFQVIFPGHQHFQVIGCPEEPSES